MKTEEDCGYWIGKERADWSSRLDFGAEKNELHAKNSMISETIKNDNNQQQNKMKKK